MLKRSLFMIFSAVLLALAILPSALADQTYYDSVILADQAHLHSDDTCGWPNHGRYTDCNTPEFAAVGPGGCSLDTPYGYPGCLMWQPSNGDSRTSATSKITLPDDFTGTLRVWTAGYGGNTQYNEKAQIHANGQLLGTTKDRYCNTGDTSCYQGLDPQPHTFPVSLHAGDNYISFTAVTNGGSFQIVAYELEGTLLQEEAPSCTATFTPDHINTGETSRFVFTSENARSVGANCNGIILSEANIPEGYTFEDVRAHNEDVSCDIYVFSEANFQGEAASCTAHLDVNTPNVTPRCTIDFDPQEITEGSSTQGTLTTEDARSVRVACSGDLGSQNLANIPEGYSDEQQLTPSASQTCVATVYEKANYQGASATCHSSITVTPAPVIPSCTIDFDPSIISLGASTIGTLDTAHARSVRVACSGDLGSQNLANIPEGYSDEQQLTPSASQGCTATVYEKANYQGASATCNAGIRVIPPEPEHARCTAAFDPEHITQGEDSSLLINTSRALSISYACDGDIASFQDPTITSGAQFDFPLSPEDSQGCWITVYPRENFQGTPFICDANIVVESVGEKDLDLSVEDVSVVENSGQHIGLVDLFLNTQFENIDEENLVYTLVSESREDIIDCFLDDNTQGDLQWISCETQQDQTGFSELTVKVTAEGLEAEDTFRVYVTPLPSCDALVDPDVLTLGEETTLHIETEDAHSLSYSCDSDLAGSETHFANGESFDFTFSPTTSGVCVVKVYSNFDFKGEKTTCSTNYIVEDTPAALELEIPDRTVDEDAGILDDFVNLELYTQYTGNNGLTYTLLGETHPDIIDCHIDFNDNKFIDCETQLNRVGSSTLTVRVTDGELVDIDTFTITVQGVNDTPLASFIQGSICQGQATTLSVTVRDPDGDAQQIEWDFGDGSDLAFGETVTHVYDDSGTYGVTITITDSDNELTVLEEDVIVSSCNSVQHKLAIQSAYVDSGLSNNYDVFHPGDYVDVYTKVKNLGNKNEAVSIIAQLPELGLEEGIPVITIQEGTGKWRVITFKLPKDIDAGEHVIRLTAESKDAQEVKYLTFTVE